MRRWWPRSMLGRTLMLLIPLMMVSVACAGGLWWTLIQRPRLEGAARVFASQILLADRFLSALSPDDRHRQLAEMNGVATRALPPGVIDRVQPGTWVTGWFANKLLAELPPEIQVRWQEAPNRQLWVRLRASDQLWLVLPAESAEGGFGLAGMFAILLALAAFPTIGAYVIHRRVEAPLKRLVHAAREIEHGQWPPPVPSQGPLELVMVTDAFNRMVSTLSDIEAAREEMLAGISHDVRTPLTKLRMVLAAPTSFDAPAASAERFIEEIDAIVGQFIHFARGADTEQATPGRLDDLVEQLAGDFAGLGHHFELDLRPLPVFAYRQISMQRLLMNLMQNAATYGRHELVVRTRVTGGSAVVSVEDGGPGIPAGSLMHMLQPFRRGASENGKGTGLGLAIADRIARQHGGSLELAVRAPRGLSVTLRIPLVAAAGA